MSASLILIDDLGTIWDGASPRLRNSYGSTASEDDFSTYVVKNMGFIAVHGYGRSCEVRLRPLIVSPAAFTALSEWIGSRKYDRIVTAHFTDDWVYGLHANGAAALAKLDALVASSKHVQPGDYLTRPLTKDQLPRTTQMHRALHSLIENWPMLSQSIHRDGLRTMIQALQGRYHIMTATGDQKSVNFNEIGGGFVSYSEDWISHAIGKSIEEHEDKNYGKWAADSCRTALQSGKPTICDVDTIINTRKIGRARVRYKRVILPTPSIGGGGWLLTSSILDHTIDLRVVGG